MIVFQNSFVTFTYTPENDILSVDWPHFDPSVETEIEQILKALVETIKNYDVKNLLIDANNTTIGVDEDTYKELLTEFAANLRQTRLEKLARVMTSDPLREERVHAIRMQNISPYQYQDFKTKEEALHWLIGIHPNS